jgi:glutaredoxin
MGRTIVFIALGVVLCSLAFYAAPSFKNTWDGFRWEALFRKASDLYDRKDYQEAAVAAKRALAGAESRLGPDGTGLSGPLTLLGKIHIEMGDHPGSVGYLERLRSIQEKALGESHEDTRGTIKLLVSVYFKQGNGDEAKSLMGRLISEQESQVSAHNGEPVFSSDTETRTVVERRPTRDDGAPGERKGQTVAAKAPAKAPALSSNEGRKAFSKPQKVELYITNWCPYCKQAVNFFQSRGISYTAYDIEKDKNAAGRKQQLDAQKGVPFAIINGQKIHGFSAAAYQRALNHD